jgi:GT2 family glycosyltransferase
MYDERYFMYFEDWDLSRRVHKNFETLYFPLVNVYHGYESGANKKFNLFIIFIKSAFKYFNKWGWFFDKDRNKVNLLTLDQF